MLPSFFPSCCLGFPRAVPSLFKSIARSANKPREIASFHRRWKFRLGDAIGAALGLHSTIISQFVVLSVMVLMTSLAGTAQTTPAAGQPPVAAPAPATGNPPIPGQKPGRRPPGIDAFSQRSRYKNANAKLGPPAPGENRVVFFGDSITANWAKDKSFFPGKPYIGRGISGETTMQMLLRFRADVIDLQPKVVVILAGTNDLAQNQGEESMDLIEDDLQSMAQLAQANHITPILCSVLPASDYPWRRGLQPGPKIVALNKWIETYCQEQHLVFLNYYPALVNDIQGTRVELTLDGVHPNPAGYAIMAPMAEAAIHQVLP
jgi:acyl-CoA thioesterase I